MVVADKVGFLIDIAPLVDRGSSWNVSCYEPKLKNCIVRVLTGLHDVGKGLQWGYPFPHFL